MLRAVLFDGVGTLCTLRNPPAQTWGKLALEYGKNIKRDQLSKVLGREFKMMPPLAFRYASAEKLPFLEREWWRQFAWRVLTQFGAFPHFDDFFERLFQLHQDPAEWRLFDDTKLTLDAVQQAGVRMAVVSNNDSRFSSILEGLGVRHYFDHVVVSSQAGFLKPHHGIFKEALARMRTLPHLHNLQPAEVLHVGACLEHDVHGSRNVGFLPVLVDRDLLQKPDPLYVKKKVIGNDEMVRKVPTLDRVTRHLGTADPLAELHAQVLHPPVPQVTIPDPHIPNLHPLLVNTPKLQRLRDFERRNDPEFIKEKIEATKKRLNRRHELEDEFYAYYRDWNKDPPRPNEIRRAPISEEDAIHGNNPYHPLADAITKDRVAEGFGMMNTFTAHSGHSPFGPEGNDADSLPDPIQPLLPKTKRYAQRKREQEMQRMDDMMRERVEELKAAGYTMEDYKAGKLPPVKPATIARRNKVLGDRERYYKNAVKASAKALPPNHRDRF